MILLNNNIRREDIHYAKSSIEFHLHMLHYTLYQRIERYISRLKEIITHKQAWKFSRVGIGKNGYEFEQLRLASASRKFKV